MPSADGLRQHIAETHDGMTYEVVDAMTEAMMERGGGGNEYAALARVHKAMHTAAPSGVYEHRKGA